MLCRYDTTALKSLDIFSVHGFPVGSRSVRVELAWGLMNGSAAGVGSGGWSNIVEKYHESEAVLRRARSRSVMLPAERPSSRSQANGSANDRGGYRVAVDENRVSWALPTRRLRACEPGRGVDRPALFRQRAVRRADGLLPLVAASDWRRSETNGLSEASGRLEQRAHGQRDPGARHRALCRRAGRDLWRRRERAEARRARWHSLFTTISVEAYQAVGIAILDAGLSMHGVAPLSRRK